MDNIRLCTPFWESQWSCLTVMMFMLINRIPGTLFRSITVFCGTHSILQNSPPHLYWLWDYSTEYCHPTDHCYGSESCYADVQGLDCFPCWEITGDMYGVNCHVISTSHTIPFCCWNYFAMVRLVICSDFVCIQKEREKLAPVYVSHLPSAMRGIFFVTG